LKNVTAIKPLKLSLLHNVLSIYTYVLKLCSFDEHQED